MADKTITISSETYEKLKDQLGDGEVLEMTCLNDMVGKVFMFRGVTYHMLGRVTSVLGNIVELEDACWVADSGCFTDFIKDGTIDEVEMVGQWFVNLDACNDFGPWGHKLPTQRK